MGAILRGARPVEGDRGPRGREGGQSTEEEERLEAHPNDKIVRQFLRYVRPPTRL